MLMFLYIQSQFTLMAKTRKGTKPDFHEAAPASTSQELYEYFLSQLRKHMGDDKVKDGRFQGKHFRLTEPLRTT